MSTNQFKSQKRYKCSMEEALRISNLPVVRHESIQDIDNTEKYDWQELITVKQVKKGDIKAGYAHGEPEDAIVANDSKYGRIMYCPKTGIVRTQTMGEFYGTRTVD